MSGVLTRLSAQAAALPPSAAIRPRPAPMFGATGAGVGDLDQPFEPVVSSRSIFDAAPRRVVETPGEQPAPRPVAAGMAERPETPPRLMAAPVEAVETVVPRPHGPLDPDIDEAGESASFDGPMDRVEPPAPRNEQRHAFARPTFRLPEPLLAPIRVADDPVTPRDMMPPAPRQAASALPAIEITIGSIEVRTEAARQPAPREAPSRPAPEGPKLMSLQDYLAKGRG